MKKNVIFLILCCLFTTVLVAQQEERTFIFGHSLIHHEFQLNPTPSQETSVPHWFHFLAQAAGHNYEVSGQYGFLPQHANLPPIAQWGFDAVTGAWESDYEAFSAADFTSILLTPGNFIQWQGPTENYPNDDTSPLAATSSIFSWCQEQEDSLTFYIYENWPDMAPFLGNEFPPNPTEWQAYISYLNDDFHNWFLEYHDLLIDELPDICIRMIPVGPVIHNLLLSTPYDQIPITDLYEDDAPHGRATIYFLAAMTTYMAIYGEPTPADYEVDPIIHPIVQKNYAAITAYIWNELNNFEDTNGNNRVFCSPLVSSTETANWPRVSVTPTPCQEELRIVTTNEDYTLYVYDLQGKPLLQQEVTKTTNLSLDVSDLHDGLYLLVLQDDMGRILHRQKVLKL